MRLGVKTIARTGWVAVLLLVGGSQASAVPTIRLDDSVNPTIECEDGDPCDSSPLPGVVVFVASIGDWLVNVSTGTTMPSVGSPGAPYLDLNSTSLSSSGPATLKILFSETGFGPVSVPLLASVAGVTFGTASFNSYWGASLFSMTNSLTSQGPYGPGAFSDSTTSGLIPGSPFALTLEVDVSHDDGGSSLTSFNLQPVPEPGTLLLLGGGLAGMALRGRRRTR